MPMGALAICWRQGRYVVSRPFPRFGGGTGYEPATNWRKLEAEARAEAERDTKGGPFVFTCPNTLALQARWPGEVEQRRLWESEAGK